MAKVFTGYTHLEEKVEALQLTSDSVDTIIRAFAEPVARMEMARMDMVYDQANMTYTFYFRYNSQSTDSTLAADDYLVRLNDGTLQAMTKQQFEDSYVNTSIDPIVPWQDRQSIKESIVSFIKAYFPAAGIDTEADLTPEILQQVANGTVNWYDAAADVYELKFNDCGILSPIGLFDILKAFPGAVFIKDTTTFKINFGNGMSQNPEKDFNKPNYFNKIGLQELMGEIKKMDVAIARRIVGLDFIGLNGAKSAVTPSVSDREWTDFCTDITAMTGISSSRQIRR